jgi:diamine N-acetyltransferase
MNVRLREITPENFKRCIELKVAEAQAGFVAPNVMSIAQSKIYPTYRPCAVYDGDEMVGFAMFGLDPDDGKFYLGRLMIDARHQGKGYGKAATLAVIDELRKNEACCEVYLSFVPDNEGAEKLYLSCGFERTGETSESGEIVMRFKVK